MTTRAVREGSVRICHLADIHLGYRRFNRLARSGHNQREVDVNTAFHEAVSRVISLRPDITIIAGDLFHAVRPSNAIVAFAFRELKRLAEGTRAPVVLIAGNHDSPKRADTGCLLRLFAEIEGVWVADSTAERFSFPKLGLSVFCIPHAALAMIDGRPIAADDTHRYNVLVAHGQIGTEWMTDFGGIDIDIERLSPREWDYIALGHIHFHRRVGFNAVYPGSIEHTSTNIWSEANERRGFVEFTLPSGATTFHALTSPRPVIVLPPIEAASMDAESVMEAIKQSLDGVAGGLDGKLVRLEIEGVSRDTLKALDHRELRRLRSLALNLTLEFRARRDSAAAVARERTGGKRLGDELKAFCTSWTFERATAAEASAVIEGLLARAEAEESEVR